MWYINSIYSIRITSQCRITYLLMATRHWKSVSKYNTKWEILFLKNHRQKASLKSFYKKSKLSLTLDQQSEMLQQCIFIWRWMVRQFWFFVPNLVVNYHLMISYPRQCHIGINVNYWHVIIIAIHMILHFAFSRVELWIIFISYSHNCHM